MKKKLTVITCILSLATALILAPGYIFTSPPKSETFPPPIISTNSHGAGEGGW